VQSFLHDSPFPSVAPTLSGAYSFQLSSKSPSATSDTRQALYEMHIIKENIHKGVDDKIENLYRHIGNWRVFG